MLLSNTHVHIPIYLHMAQNIELKLQVKNLAAIELLVQKIATNPKPKILHQKDTYYHVPKGRMKLRLINGKHAELIVYNRTNSAQARSSTYFLYKTRYPSLLDRRLRHQYGLRTIVKKRRVVYMYQNTRIHLDAVAGLGSFVEFEYVVSPDFPSENGVGVLDFLIARLEMGDAVACAGSYVDLMEERCA